jgi:hypothetical protein
MFLTSRFSGARYRVMRDYLQIADGKFGDYVRNGRSHGPRLFETWRLLRVIAINL